MHVARNGQEAAERIAELQPDLAFLDIQMPGLTGLEVAEGIEGGGPLLPPDVEELAPDLISKYMGARDGTEKAKVAGEAIDRSIAELKKKIAAAKKGG